LKGKAENIRLYYDCNKKEIIEGVGDHYREGKPYLKVLPGDLEQTNRIPTFD